MAVGVIFSAQVYIRIEADKFFIFTLRAFALKGYNYKSGAYSYYSYSIYASAIFPPTS